MDDYIETLEEQNEELRTRLTALEDMAGAMRWRRGPNDHGEFCQKHLYFGTSLVAQYFRSVANEKLIIATIYSAEQHAGGYKSKDDCKSVKEAKEWIYETIFGGAAWTRLILDSREA